jgi:hypothetical protein
MTLEEFEKTLQLPAPPPTGMPVLDALWWAAKGEWARAHAIVQEENDRNAAWVHAYLHRVEGDLDNAGYWYRRAGRHSASGAFEAEWSAIAAALVGDSR